MARSALDTRLVLAHAFDPMGVAAHTRKRMLARGLTDDHLVRVERRAARLLLDAAAQNVTGPSAEAGGGVKMECVSTGRRPPRSGPLVAGDRWS